MTWLGVGAGKEDSRYQHEYLAALQETAASLIARRDLDDVLAGLIARAARLLDTPHSCLFYAEPNADQIERRVGAGLYSQLLGARRRPGEGLAGKVWQTGQPLIVDDYDAWAGRAPDVAHNLIRAAIAVPFMSSAQVAGVIGVALGPAAEPERVFDSGHVDLLKQFAQLASIAVDNARLFHQTQTALQASEGLYQAAWSISSAASIQEICQNLAGHFNHLVRADRTVIFLADHARRELSVRVGAGHLIEGRDLQLTYDELWSGLGGLVLRSGQPVLSLSADDGLEPEATRARRLADDTGALIVAPLTVQGGVLGVVTAMNRAGQAPFTPKDVETLMTLAALAATAIANVRLLEAARTANQALARRAAQLEAASQVGRQATSILDMGEMLAQAVNSIQAQFGYYFVGLWLVTDQKDYAVLRAGTGRVGTNWHGLRLPIDAPPAALEVCRTGQPRRADRASGDLILPAPEALPAQCSEIALPLRVGDRLMGALDILSDQPAAFTPEDQTGLQTLADQIAIAIRNAQMYGAEQHRRHLAEALEQAGRELISSLDLREVPGRILEQLAVVVPYDQGTILLRQADEFSVAARRVYDDSTGEAEMEPGVIRHIAETGRALVVDAAPQAPAGGDLSWLGVPLAAKGAVTGLLALARRGTAFSRQDMTLASAFAGQAAIALENARLYDETAKFNELLERMVEARVQEFHEAIRSLQHLDKTKSRFIEVTAHELRTPLTLVKGYAAMLSSLSVGQGPDTQPLLEGIVTGVNRLHEIVNSMLDVAKIDSQTLNMRREPVKPLSILNRIAFDFAGSLRERGLTLTMDGVDALPLLEADGALLHKVFGQLVANAIKYTPDGGRISVSGSLIAGDGYDSAVEIVVCDTGIGIEPEHHELIFEKFYQMGEVALHSSGQTKFKGGGPGLGLAIARGIVHAHGGKIWVNSAGHDEDRCPGSQFHVLLPVKGA